MATASISKDDVLDVISNMTVMEIVDLISAMEEKFGVSAAAAAVAAAPAAGAAGEAAEEEAATERTVMLTSVGDNKIGVIKVIRAITGLGLKESKEMVEGAPSAVKEEVPAEEAEDLKKQLEEAGATVELK